MFVLMVDPVTDTARGLALPRDLWVQIPIDDTPGNYIENRINTAYRNGELGATKAAASALSSGRSSACWASKSTTTY